MLPEIVGVEANRMRRLVMDGSRHIPQGCGCECRKQRADTDIEERRRPLEKAWTIWEIDVGVVRRSW